ncbi:MAG: hypothetical protein ICV81_17900, partial [Flavisolibacter sp.]|nr:hypothetical protein [Flavisolibacter sp.]
MRCSRLFFALLWFFLFSITSASAQLGFDLDIKKPEPYDNRELRAERTSQKKFTLTRRIYQGTTTHYNYFFNA